MEEDPSVAFKTVSSRASLLFRFSHQSTSIMDYREQQSSQRHCSHPYYQRDPQYYYSDHWRGRWAALGAVREPHSGTDSYSHHRSGGAAATARHYHHYHPHAYSYPHHYNHYEYHSRHHRHGECSGHGDDKYYPPHRPITSSHESKEPNNVHGHPPSKYAPRPPAAANPYVAMDPSIQSPEYDAANYYPREGMPHGQTIVVHWTSELDDRLEQLMYHYTHGRHVRDDDPIWSSVGHALQLPIFVCQHRHRILQTNNNDGRPPHNDTGSEHTTITDNTTRGNSVASPAHLHHQHQHGHMPTTQSKNVAKTSPPKTPQPIVKHASRMCPPPSRSHCSRPTKDTPKSSVTQTNILKKQTSAVASPTPNRPNNHVEPPFKVEAASKKTPSPSRPRRLPIKKRASPVTSPRQLQKITTTTQPETSFPRATAATAADRSPAKNPPSSSISPPKQKAPTKPEQPSITKSTLSPPASTSKYYTNTNTAIVTRDNSTDDASATSTRKRKAMDPATSAVDTLLHAAPQSSSCTTSPFHSLRRCPRALGSNVPNPSQILAAIQAATAAQHSNPADNDGNCTKNDRYTDDDDDCDYDYREYDDADDDEDLVIPPPKKARTKATAGIVPHKKTATMATAPATSVHNAKPRSKTTNSKTKGRSKKGPQSNFHKSAKKTPVNTKARSIAQGRMPDTASDPLINLFSK